MTDTDPTRSTPPAAEPAPSPRHEPDTFQPAEDPGYLIETGQAVGEDGSVAPIIGGLPAVEGSAWDTAPRWTTAVRTWLTSRIAHRLAPPQLVRVPARPDQMSALVGDPIMSPLRAADRCRGVRQSGASTRSVRSEGL